MDHLPVDAYDWHCWIQAIAAGVVHDCEHCHREFELSSSASACQCFHCLEWRYKAAQAQGWPEPPKAGA